jgi:glycine cleavage system aminomethyltransferase T
MRTEEVMAPLRQSALHWSHLAAQAHLGTFSGWQLPAWYTESSREVEEVRASVGISDASYLYKLDLRGQAGGLSLPARVWKLTPTHAWITSPPTSPLPSLASASLSVTDVTSVYSAILLAGPKAREVLQKLTTLNVREGSMPDGAARQTRVAHANATVLRSDCETLPGFLILNTRDLAEHVWSALLHAGSPFGARPFGMVAQQQLMGLHHGDA